jgi:hypothetical protein
VKLFLDLPKGKSDDFDYKGRTEIDTTVTGTAKTRSAFVGIKPLSKAPRQKYTFRVRVLPPGGEAVIYYPLQTIRGAAVSPGRLAVLLPAGIAAAWCIVLAIFLARNSARGAWYTPSEPATEPEAPEEWITRNPA